MIELQHPYMLCARWFEGYITASFHFSVSGLSWHNPNVETGKNRLDITGCTSYTPTF
jgi:hypothetical protein